MGDGKAKAVERSPFLKPRDTRQKIAVETPGGTVRMSKKHVEEEHKAGIYGTSANLVVSIVGAGIVGIPFAMEQIGLVSGFGMIILVAFLTDKSLRLLIETAKHIDVPSYETLFEACFGIGGFYIMCGTMFVMSYGAMVSYLMIMKDTLSSLLGVAPDDYPMKRTVLIISTLIIALPLSSQRDMADLAKTSRISVTFYLCIVAYILVFSPVGETIAEKGGIMIVLSKSIYRAETFFVGLGVLSFAFVCQHSAFILAGSLERPTSKRWSHVTHISLLFSGALAIACGVSGYLGFLEETQGNVLLNFKDSMGDNPLVLRLNTVSFIMLLTCMFFVYPMDAFVLRHVSMVLVFKGRAAHEGDDHLVLARTDRRLLLTFSIYIVTLLPALLLEDLGKVLAVTGAVAGSALSYICPGATYLAAHGSEYIKLVRERWTWGNPESSNNNSSSNNSEKITLTVATTPTVEEEEKETNDNILTRVCNICKLLIGRITWILLLMPIWMGVAKVGAKCLSDHAQKEAIKSPKPSKRLGKVSYKRSLSQRAKGVHTPDLKRATQAAAAAARKVGIGGGTLHRDDVEMVDDEHETSSLLENPKNMIRHNSLDGLDPAVGKLPNINYGSANSTTSTSERNNAPRTISGAIGNRAIGAAIMKQNQASIGRSSSGNGVTVQSNNNDEEELDLQADFPQLYDFIAAIAFIVFGWIAMIAGLYSIFA